jgi:hypothetical protein
VWRLGSVERTARMKREFLLLALIAGLVFYGGFRIASDRHAAETKALQHDKEALSAGTTKLQGQIELLQGENRRLQRDNTELADFATALSDQQRRDPCARCPTAKADKAREEKADPWETVVADAATKLVTARSLIERAHRECKDRNLESYDYENHQLIPLPSQTNPDLTNWVDLAIPVHVGADPACQTATMDARTFLANLRDAYHQAYDQALREGAFNRWIELEIKYHLAGVRDHELK